MKYSLRSSFAKWVLVLFFAVLALTVVGRIVATTGAIAHCNGFPFCAPTHPLGWLKQAHILLVGLASILMLVVFRKAWREQREQRIILPLKTILGVMFFGQAVDPATEARIQSALETILRGRTSIVIAHRLAMIRSADRILVLHHGRLTEEGTHEELLRVPGGIYRALHALQSAPG